MSSQSINLRPEEQQFVLEAKKINDEVRALESKMAGIQREAYQETVSLTKKEEEGKMAEILSSIQ